MIIDNQELKNICRNIKNNSTGIIGIDTEFIRKYEYHPVLCTIQVIYFDKNKNENIKFILDILQKELDLKPFLSILKSHSIKKVMHSCGQDIEAIYYAIGAKVNNYDDTQIMAEFCGYTFNIGYATAINDILKIDFEKNREIQVSNWKIRPLTEKQISYALNDVEYLIELYNFLHLKIREYGNYEYYLNEMKYQEKFRTAEYIIKNSWKKVRIMLNKKNMVDALLIKELTRWREKETIENNTIRNHILTNQALEYIVNIKPTTLKELKSIYTENKEILSLKRSYKNNIISIINDFKRINTSSYEKQIYYTNETGFKQKKLLNEIYQKVLDIAKLKNIAPCRLLNKIDIISIIMHYENKREILYGWKHKLLNNIITTIIKKNN